jgi:hypothetical protein
MCCMVCHFGDFGLVDLLDSKGTPHLLVADNHRGRGAVLVPRVMLVATS